MPALFSAVTVLCLAVLTACAMARLLPYPGRRSLWLTPIVAAGIVLDGWAVRPVVDVPALIPVTSADLVIELPRANAVLDDVAAMYRAIEHGQPIVNGYSGYSPPHYLFLTEDLRRGCVESLDAVRGPRSLDVVIWRDRKGAAALDAAVRQRWGTSDREESIGVIRYHLPRAPERPSFPLVSPSELRGFCAEARARS